MDDLPNKATVRAAVAAAVNTVDPEGLLAGGAPDDEYDPEIEDLTGRIVRNTRIDRRLVQQVWSQWFGTPSRLDDVRADEMVALIKRQLAT